MGKYIVILVVALFAVHLLLSRTRTSSNKTARGESLRRAFESTFRKTAIAVGALIAALAIVLLVKHVTS